MSTCPHCGNDIEAKEVNLIVDFMDGINLNVTVDVGPHLSHLFKRFFPKSQQSEINGLTKELSDSETSLKDAVETNTPP